MMFTFVYTGWEVTANDSRVFTDAVLRPENEFPFPKEGCYYVVDAGYIDMPEFLAPYRVSQGLLLDLSNFGLVRWQVSIHQIIDDGVLPAGVLVNLHGIDRLYFFNAWSVKVFAEMKRLSWVSSADPRLASVSAYAFSAQGTC
ncbi:hypothetical protein L3X38_012380 [Prunus dulcis]|uniref:DDE Tnp4 domain-containing protein n=1 Tax=Prunus dulcis TaxID=3755 RepID=A0AAD4WJY8_PRUDU|nr:hypothetical protein L3X38_012380 [Prunus dulcis]